MDCRLLIPSLFQPPGGVDTLAGVNAPALRALLGRGAQRETAPGLAAWLCGEFGVTWQGDLPVASLTLLADGGEPGHHYWLRADPAHLVADRDRLVLAATGDLGLSEEQSVLTATALNKHFLADGMVFFAPNPARWYLRLAHAPALQTFPPFLAMGRNIMDFLPSGADGMRWRGVLNEIQMLLHGLAENAGHGEPEVNALWLWGGGVLPHEVISPFAHVWAEDPLARGLAAAATVPCAKPPRNATDWLAQLDEGSHLVVLGDLQDAMLVGDPQRWRDALEHLDRAWFEPLRQALRRGQLSRLSLVSVDGVSREFNVSGSDLWKFWRTGKELAAYLSHN
jgi:hypothetical protein